MEKLKKQITIKIERTLQRYDLLVSNKELARMACISESTLKCVFSGHAELKDSLKVCKLLGIELNVNFEIC